MIRYVVGLGIPLLIFGLVEMVITDHLYPLFGWISPWTISYCTIALLGYAGLFLAMGHWRKSPLKRSALLNFMIGLGFVSVVMKLVFLILLLFYDIVEFVVSYFTDLPSAELVIPGLFVLSLFPFFALMYGILWGKYRFKLEQIDLTFSDLPDAFDGFKIVQFSDAHSGTWDSLKGVEKGIRLIEDQKADMIVFTGDLVNADKDEINPFIHLFERLSAPYGKYAILGNHDYYGQPKVKEQRSAYYDDFYTKFRKMDFDLLLNDSREIKINGHAIKIIGVENWGSGRFFPKRGDLDTATKSCSSDDFSILLSHDPSHWELKALNHPQHFHLTLSGHTHGMQFGINLPFFKWSPVSYRYKHWMGLYQKANQYLYVNRGFGVLGYPGRVGMSPEVTLIKFHKTKT